MSHSHHSNHDNVEVYAPDTKTLYTVPRQAISHNGNGDQGSGKSRLLVCRSYCNAIEAGQAPSEITACAMGNQCRFVHIDVPLNQLKGDIIHVHYIYREPSLCIYERLSTAMAREQPQNAKRIEEATLMIYGPNNREPVEHIPVSELLLTGGSRYAFDCFMNPRRSTNGQAADPPRVCHCAHYYFTQTCNRGANCSFIHVVSIDAAQKTDSSKPTNYRRRVGQLGQTEVPQMAMTPQVAYHSPMGSQANTPLTGQHLRSPGSNQHGSPFLQNARSPFNNAQNNKATFATSSPFLPAEGNNQIGFDSYNNSSNIPNLANGQNEWQQGNPTSKTTSVYVGHRPQQPLEAVYLPREQVTVGVKQPHQSHFPPSPTVQQHQNGNKQLPTSMLPMDDVDEEAADRNPTKGHPTSYTNYHSNPDFTLGQNHYTEGSSTDYAPRQPQGYTNSNRASPMHTPSTGMHLMPSTPKVSAGRYAHNPYAGSPVTTQNVV
eukprot:GILJ01003718.1.p1 GENE.GILJ01003718.1~~GILJ01003718.1.p1  ORF type:complete len:488 (+),score=74.86 GILJ01003718.1:2-1465(+)